MKNNLKISLLVFAFLAQTACTSMETSSTVEDDFADLELVDEAPKTSSLQADAASALKSQDQSKIESELATINSQISSLDTQIASAKARLNHYQFMNTPAKDSLIGSAQSEIFSLESQKNGLLTRRSQLQADLSAQ